MASNRLRVNFRVLVICCFFLLITGIAHAQKKTLSIKDVLALVESGQPRLRAYRAQSSAAGYDVDLAKNTFVPDLIASYQAGYTTDNNITGMSYPGLMMPIS